MTEKKKATPKSRTVKQCENSAKTARGKPFEKGHKHAWKPGQSGNPQGRPRSNSLSEELRTRLQEHYPGRDDATYGRMLAHKLIDLAIAGELGAIKEVFDRLEGKPRQALNISTESRQRAVIERALESLKATGLTDDEAAAYLAAAIPEAGEWIN